MSYDIFKVESFIRNEYENKRYYKLENDKIKEKSYVNFSYPLVDSPLLQINNIRSSILADIYARFLRLIGKNVLFSVGCDDLASRCSTNFKNTYKAQYELLDIGFDKEKEIITSDKKFIKFVQELFIDLYRTNYIIYKDENYYFSIKEIKQELVNQFLLEKDFQSLESLGYYKGVLVDFKLSNDSYLELDISAPENIGAMNFIAINPEYENINLFIEDSEKEYILDYLDGISEQMGVFTGIYAINPITNDLIPIIITREFNYDIYVGFASLNPVDYDFSNQFELEYKNTISYIQGHKILINSGIFDGLDIKVAKNDIILELVNNHNGVVYEDILNNEICITTNYLQGLAVPMYLDGDIVSNEYLPIIIDESNIKITKDNKSNLNLVNLVFNNEFIRSVVSVAIKIKTEIGLYSFNTWEFIDEFEQFNKEYFGFYDSHLTNLFNKTLSIVINKECKLNEESLNKVILVSEIFDDAGNIITRSNNNLINLPQVIKDYGASSLRRYIASFDSSNSIIFDEINLVESYKDTIKFIELFDLDFNHNDINDSTYCDFLESALKHLLDLNFSDFISVTSSFINYCHTTKNINYTKAKGLLIVYSIIAPSLCEQIYKDKFNSKSPLLYEFWPEK